MNDLRVRDVMTHLVVSFRPQDSIREVAASLLANRISGGPVVSGGKVVGVVSEADIAQGYSPAPGHNGRIRAIDPLMFRLRGDPAPGWADATVAEVMTRAAVTTTPDAPVGDAARLMDRHSIRRLPVVDPDGYVCGVIARADVVRALARQWQAEMEPAGTLGA